MMTDGVSTSRKRRARRYTLAAFASLLTLLQAHAVRALEVMTSAPWDRALSRYVTRSENTGARLALSLGTIVTAWLWIGLSMLVFLLVVLFAAVADWHMFSLLGSRVRELPLYMYRGGSTFLRAFRDRNTPNYARLALLGGLGYWLLPFDLVPDESIIPGFFEDILVAIVSAKAFVAMCPDGVIAKHARSLYKPGPPKA